MGIRTDEAGTPLGPLTTAWSMPDSCKTHFVKCPTCTDAYMGQRCSRTKGAEAAHDHTTCWPPAAARAGTPTPAFFGWGFYSPGLACPTGYTTACTAEHGGRSEWDIQFTLVAGETAVGCCPEYVDITPYLERWNSRLTNYLRGYRCTNNFGNTCIAVIHTQTQIAVATGTCSGTEMVGVATASFPDIITVTIPDPSYPASSAIETVTREMNLFAPMFQLNYKASDLAPGSSPATTTITQTTPPSLTPTTTAGSDANDNTSPSDSSPIPVASEEGGLSTGAVVGIGVGAALGGIFLVAVLGWLWWRRRVRRRTDDGTWSEPQEYKQEPFSQLRYTSPGPGGHAPVELDGPSHVPVELDGHTSAELSSESGRRLYYK